MIPAILNTNEVKNAAGTEEQFIRRRSNDRMLVFAKENVPPNLDHTLTISHLENGSGVDKVRRSMVRVDKTVLGVSGLPRTISKYEVTVIPVGDIANYNDVKDVSANLGSFTQTTGAATTVLFDGTGHGSDAAINGTL